MIRHEIDLLQKLTRNIGRVMSSSQFIEKQSSEGAIDIDRYVKEKIAKEIGLMLLDEGIINFSEESQLGGKIVNAEFRYIKIEDIKNFIKNN